jgi:hypothetical protein
MNDFWPMDEWFLTNGWMDFEPFAILWTDFKPMNEWFLTNGWIDFEPFAILWTDFFYKKKNSFTRLL